MIDENPKKIFKEHIGLKIEANFNSQYQYFNSESHLYYDLKDTLNEINNCLIFELYQASITLTNNLLERLFKLTLIYSDTGIGPFPINEWNSIFEEPNLKYNSITFSKSINLCFEKGLLNESEKDFLIKIIKEQFRNGFSHADPKIILRDLSTEATFFHGNFSNPTSNSSLNLNQKSIPVLQAIHISKFAKDNALLYFEFAYSLIEKINQRLINL